MSHFSLPPMVEHSGWGPVPAASADAKPSSSSNGEAGSVAAYQPVPAGAFMFAELPFQPFNKNDKLWRVSDWTSKEGERWGGGGGGRAQWGNKDGSQGVGILGDDGVVPDEADGGAFSIVDNRPKLKPRYGKTTFKRGLMQQGGQRGNQRGAANNGFQRGTRTGRGGFNQRGGRGGRGGRNQRMQRPLYGDRSAAELRQASVLVSEEWPLVLDIDMAPLGNFVADVDGAEDLHFAGALEAVNPKMNYITPRNPVPLQRFETRQHFTATTSDDPILAELQRSESDANVFATDVILSALMASPRSVNSWDILVRKDGERLVLDKRPQSRLDFVSVNENAADGGAAAAGVEKDSINHPDALSAEATLINHNYSQQLLSVPANAAADRPLPHQFERDNPFLSSLAKGNEPASVAFRYRKLRLGGGFTLVSRCSLNGFVERRDGGASSSEGGKAMNFVVARALNEWDSRAAGTVDWRQKLESQTGAVLASEMKNNMYKLSRWVGEALLSGADELRLGFVSRANPKSNAKHAILMSKTYTASTFADSVNVQARKLWGTLAQLLTHLRKLPDGHFVLLRDPQKPTLHVYQVPADAFDHELDDIDEGDM